MRMRALVAALGSAVLVIPMSIGAQDAPTADFTGAREQFLSGAVRQAAQTLLRSTLYLRQQVGRSRDEVVGMQLLNAESQLETLAAGIGGGRGNGIRALDQALVHIDRLLAQHHLQVASTALVKPRADALMEIVSDLRRGAFHVERSFTLVGGTPSADVHAAVLGVRSLATDIESTRQVPGTAVATVRTLELQVAALTAVTVSLR